MLWSNIPLLRPLLPDGLKVEVVEDLPEDLLCPRRPALRIRHNPDVVRPKADFKKVSVYLNFEVICSKLADIKVYCISTASCFFLLHQSQRSTRKKAVEVAMQKQEMVFTQWNIRATCLK